MSASQLLVNTAYLAAGGVIPNNTLVKGAYASLVLLAAGQVTTPASGVSAAVVVPGALATDIVVATKTAGATANTGVGTAILASAGLVGANYVFTGATAEVQTISYCVYRKA